MKTRNNLIAVAALVAVIFTFGFINKPEAKGGILTMRTTEALNGNWDNSIIIVDEEGKVEKVELKKLKFNDMSQNLVLINENLNKIKSRGYRLISTSQGGAQGNSGTSGEGYIMTTYSFEKD